MTVFAITIFLSSFLLFQLQPLIGKYILPWFGGGVGVWATCMLFFQVMLLVGYSYAHLATLLDRKKQGYLHVGLLLAALLFLPIAPSPEQWKPVSGENPSLKILLLLLVNLGVPYVALAASAPLLQHWYIRTYPGKSPYRLYALSNAGSLSALLGYPFLVEPNLTLAGQMTAWGWGFVCLVLFSGTCAALLRPGRPAEALLTALPANGAEPIRMFSVLQWLLLSACGSIMLLATTNILCQDIPSVPFLWVTPLAIYLLTFILCFNSHKHASRPLWGVLLALATLPAGWQFISKYEPDLWVVITVYLTTLFVSCMACHGELTRSRPNPRHLTAYYLSIAAGGALGSCFVTLAAPLLFNGFWEYPLGLVFSCVLVAVSSYRNGTLTTAPKWQLGILALCQILFVAITVNYYVVSKSGALVISRNFYGVLKLYLQDDTVGRKLLLVHGHVRHGWQYLNPDKRGYTTAYYGPDSGAGLAFRFHPRRFSADPDQRNLRVGVIGLGAGTLAAYGQPGDRINFYEIDPDEITLANRYFSFCRNSAAQIGFIEGDGRIMLESELKLSGSQHYDLLVVDAFSSDAIPTHLLTREGFAVYRQHLNPDGLIAVHLSNNYLDLTRIVQSQGVAAGFLPRKFTSPANEATGVEDATWMILMPNPDFLGRNEVSSKADPIPGQNQKPVIWSDDFASLWQILK